MKTSNLRIIFLLFFLSFSASIIAQQKVIDSLENALLIHTKKDTTRVNNLDRLAFLYYRKDINKAIKYIERAETLAKEIHFKKGIGNATYMRGVVEMAQSNFDLSIEHFKNAAEIYESNDIKKNMAGCYNGIGMIYSEQTDYEQSTVYYKKAIQIDKEVGIERNIPNYITNIGINYLYTGKYPEALANFKKGLAAYKKNNNTLGISACLKNIALIYQSQGNYPLALEYNNKALFLAEKLQDSMGISYSLNNISIIYKNQKNYEKSLKMLEKALAIQEKSKNYKGIAATKNNMASVFIQKEENNTAIKYLNEALEINRKINSKVQTASCLNNLGYVHVSLKKYNDAYNYYDEAKNINIKIENQAGLSYSYLGLADSYVDQKNYNDALPYVLKSKEIAEKLNLLDYIRDTHQLLSEIYESKEQYKEALINHQQFKILNDSLFNKENIEKNTQLEYEYKYKQALDSASIRELKLTKTVRSTSQDLEKSQQNYLWAIIAVLLVSILLGGIIFYLKLRNVKSKTQNIIMEQKLLRSQMTPHFIFNSLSVLQGMILNKEEEKSILYLSKFSKLLRITLENSRDKTVPLHQELEAVNNYLELQNLEVSQSYQYTILVDEKIDATLFEIPPMLIQPFIENAIEHGFKNQKENRKIDVQLKYSNKELICTIKDNGIGIEVKQDIKNGQKKSLATTITSERLKKLSKDFITKGSVVIENRRKYNEQGTIVTLVIPYKYA